MYSITLVFILLDFITGIIKALKEKNLNSTTMREGLFHKLGSCIAIFLGILCEYSFNYFDIGVNAQVAYCICGYIVLMEIISIIENIGVINPELIPKELQKIFLKLQGGSNNDRSS